MSWNGYLSPEAIEDLQDIGDPTVWAEIFDIARSELATAPDEGAFEGVLVDDPNIWHRRAIYRRDLSKFLESELSDSDEFRCQSSYYVILYRAMTDDEQIDYHASRGSLLVVRVVDSPTYAHLVVRRYSRQIDA